MIHYFLVLMFLVPWTALGVLLVLIGWLLTPDGQIPHQVGRIWSWGILKTSRMNLTVEGQEHIDIKSQYIFVSNHTSAFDIPAVYWGIKNKQGMLAKKQLMYVPFFGWAMWAAGNFFVDRKDHKKAIAIMDQVALQLKENKDHSLVIFPEGTRSLDGQLQRFKKGAFILSLDTGIPIVPLVINGAFDAKSKEGNRIDSTTIRITILPPVNPDKYDHKMRQQFVDDVHDLFVENYDVPA